MSGSALPNFEELRQRAGLMLYQTTLNDKDGVLLTTEPRDRVYVYVNNVSFSVLFNRNVFICFYEIHSIWADAITVWLAMKSLADTSSLFIFGDM